MTEEETINPNALKSELNQFIGTEHYYATTFGILNVTDGVQYLRLKANCFWLVDIIESYNLHDKKVQKAPFQIWTIKVNEDKSAVVTCKEDSNLDPIVTQEIPYTDFPLDEYELWCIDKVVLLKSEY